MCTYVDTYIIEMLNRVTDRHVLYNLASRHCCQLNFYVFSIHPNEFKMCDGSLAKICQNVCMLHSHSDMATSDTGTPPPPPRFFTYIVFVNFAFYHSAIASMFDSLILSHKFPVFSFKKLSRSEKTATTVDLNIQMDRLTNLT